MSEEKIKKHQGRKAGVTWPIQKHPLRLALTFMHAYVTIKPLQDEFGLIDGMGNADHRGSIERAAWIWLNLDKIGEGAKGSIDPKTKIGVRTVDLH